jgi:hypothetical protein
MRIQLQLDSKDLLQHHTVNEAPLSSSDKVKIIVAALGALESNRDPLVNPICTSCNWKTIIHKKNADKGITYPNVTPEQSKACLAQKTTASQVTAARHYSSQCHDYFLIL